MAIDEIQRGDKVILARVTLDVAIPNGVASEQEITDWLRFYLGQSGCLTRANPLADQEPTIISGSLQWDVVKAGIAA